MATEVLGDMLVRYRADISDLTSKVKAAKSDMSSMAEATDKSTKQMTSSFKNTSNEAEKTVNNLKHTLSNTLSFVAGQTIFAGMSAGLGYLKEQIGSVFKVAMDHQQIMAQTNQVLKSTKDVSGMAARSLDDLATSFSKTTQFSADTVQSGENLLLTFTNIGKDVFPQTTQAILDVSQAMGQDLKSSAIQVGKALGEPLTGMTALQRIGVTFSDTEKEQIKTMMAHNNIIGAQKVILKELSTEFGGSATAAGKTFGGEMAILNNEIEDQKIKIGDALMPIVTQFFQYIKTNGMPQLEKFSTWFQHDGIPLIVQFGDWFQKQGIPRLIDFGQQVLTVVTAGVHFVQWLHDGSAPAQLFIKAAIALGIAIAAIKLAGVVSDMKNFISSVPEMVAKMFLVQQSAEGVAGAKGLGAVSKEAGNAEKAMATAASGMKLSLAGVLGAIGLVAAGEIGIAMWLRDNNIVPKAGTNQPDWVTHRNPDDAIKQTAKDAKDLQDQINQAWKDMDALFTRYDGRRLGNLSDKLGLTKADSDLIYTKSKMDDLTKPLKLPSMVPFTSDMERARLKAIELGKKITDLDNPVAISIGTISVDAAISKVRYLKSQLDDSGGAGVSPGGVPHLASGGFIQSSGLAFVHAGETVIPASGYGAQTSSIGGSQGGQTLQFIVDGVVLAQIVNRSSDRLVRLKLGSGGRAA